MSDVADELYIPSSGKRRFLAFYLNAITAVTAVTVAMHFIAVPEEQKSIIRWSVAFIFAALNELWLGKTPGHYALSITPYGVNAHIYMRETWLSMFAGVLFILDGCKRTVRWTEMGLAEPVMGRQRRACSSVLIIS